MKRKPKYPDQLLTPIVKSNRLAGLSEEEERWYVFERKVEKLYCMADYYNIDLKSDPQDWTRWACLALRLAENLSGFHVVDSVAKLPRSRGRPRNSGEIDRYLLRRVIEMMRSKDPTLAVASACEELSKGKISKAFKGKNAGSLQTAYYKAVKSLKDSDVAVDAMLTAFQAKHELN